MKIVGANCAACPMQTCAFCPPAPSANAKYVIIGEGPGHSEIEQGIPFVGMSGRMVNQGLVRAGLRREDAHVTNATLCLPEGRLKGKEWAQALEACSGRLAAEIAGRPTLAFGAKALQTLTGHGSIGKWFGYPIQTQYGPVMPVHHPVMVMRQPWYRPTWFQQVARFGAWVNGQLPLWQWPCIELGETPQSLALLHAMQSDSWIAFDVETAGKDPMHDKMLCLGIGSSLGGVSVRWPLQRPAHVEAVRALLCERKVGKAAHFAQHDLLTLEANGVHVGGVVTDTLLAHAARYPQLPHDLGFACAQHFFAPRWKSDYKDDTELKGEIPFTEHSSIEELMTYNAKDCIMTANLARVLTRADAQWTE